MQPTPSHPPTPRPWCLRLAIALVLLGALLNLLFLFNHCPFQFSEDEAHYWDWARHLDYGYYSKPPGIAWLMYATLHIASHFGLDPTTASGQTLMPILRLPAVLFATLSGLLSLFLTRRIFKNRGGDLAALAVTLLSAAAPMFAIGSLLITIDSPMYLCWAATLYCLWRHIENNTLRIHHSPFTIHYFLWLYLAALACSAGMLFKPVLIAILLCALLAAAIDPIIKRALKTLHSLFALLIVLASQIPVILWNAHHNWVTFRHIGTQGGLNPEASDKPASLLAPLARLGEFIGGQAGGMAGLLFILLVIATLIALKLRKNPSPKFAAQYALLTQLPITNYQLPDHQITKSPNSLTTPLTFLLAFTLPLWLFYLVLSLWKGTEINWPAASYFTGMILLAGIFTAGWNSAVSATRRWWRLWGTITIGWGILLVAVLMNLHRFYPFFPALAKHDPAALKLHGFLELAAVVQAERQKILADTHQDPLLITARYGSSSSLSFYLPDHPLGGEQVFCIMSSVGGRHNQYDLWPGPNQKNSDGSLKFAGRPALIIGINKDDPAINSFIKPAFDRLEGPDIFTITTYGVTFKTLTIFRGYGFKGFPNTQSGTY